MIIKLDRPLVALDVETHDKVAPERAYICELGFKVLYPDEREPKRWVNLIKPPVLITPEAISVHGITNEAVEKASSFAQLAQNLGLGFVNCDFCGYNVRFDLQVIKAEMDRAKVAWSYEGARLLDGLRLWQVAKPRSLSDAVEEFLGRKPTEAHRALGDAEDALDVALAILERFDKLPRDMKLLHELCFKVDPSWLTPDGRVRWLGKAATLSFGKHSGVPLRDVPRNYLEWVLGADFSADIKKIITGCLAGQYPERE